MNVAGKARLGCAALAPVLVIVLGSAHAAPAPARSTSGPAAVQPIGPGGSWKLTFHDEFNGARLNTSTWATGWFGSGVTGPINASEQECYAPGQVKVSGGMLTITVARSACAAGGQTYPYRSGLISSNPSSGAPNQPTTGFQQAYGFFQARIYLPGSGGAIDNWPAWWTDGQNWPQDGEMDVLEGLGGKACYHFHSPAGGPGACASGTFTGWHTYGADWQPGSVTYYYDGKAVGTITTGITSAPMYLILNDAVSSTTGGPSRPTTMKVAYVRVWSKST